MSSRIGETRPGTPQNPAKLSRAELAEMARILRDDEKLTFAEIAAELLVSRSYASELYYDPDGSKSKARKAKHRRPCPGCGEPMYGIGKKSASLCSDCAKKKATADRYWTPETIRGSFLRFYDLFGRPPTTTDANATAASIRRTLSPERLAELDAYIEGGRFLPQPWVADREFGGWKAALAAVGLPQAANGGAAHRGPHGYSQRWLEEVGLGEDAATSTLDVVRQSRRGRSEPVEPWMGFCPSCGDSDVQLVKRTGWCRGCTSRRAPVLLPVDDVGKPA